MSDLFAEVDVGNLCITNIVNLKSSLFSKDINEDEVKRVASYGVQQLLNEVLKLPIEYHEHVPVVKLPEPSTSIPREKRVPVEKPLTRWQKFAKEKGIQHRKRDKLVWDQRSKDWKPRFGYRSAKNDKSDWMMEVPDHIDPNEDMFAKKIEAKKERVAKNEYQRLRNIADANKIKVTNLESVDAANRQQLARSLVAAKRSTASLGKFTEKLPKEKPPRNKMQKRKFQQNISTDMKGEKNNYMKIFESLDKKNPKLNMEEAVQRYTSKFTKRGRDDSDDVGEKRGNKPVKSKRSKFVKNLLRDKNNKKKGKKSRGKF